MPTKNTHKGTKTQGAATSPGKPHTIRKLVGDPVRWVERPVNVGYNEEGEAVDMSFDSNSTAVVASELLASAKVIGRAVLDGAPGEAVMYNDPNTILVVGNQYMLGDGKWRGPALARVAILRALTKQQSFKGQDALSKACGLLPDTARATWRDLVMENDSIFKAVRVGKQTTYSISPAIKVVVEDAPPST